MAMPRAKFAVPSIGSTYQVSGPDPSRTPASSPTIVESGWAARISSLMRASQARS